jgi:hypothetical protein
MGREQDREFGVLTLKTFGRRSRLIDAGHHRKQLPSPRTQLGVSLPGSLHMNYTWSSPDRPIG